MGRGKTGKINNTPEKARAYVLRLLKFRPRTISEINDKLRKKGYKKGTIENLIRDFRKKKYLDDKMFARLWVSDRMSFKPEGCFLLGKELEKKGVCADIIKEVLADSAGKDGEYELARVAALKRKKVLGRIDKTKSKKRTYDHLLRRGFDFETAYKVIEEIY